VKTEFNEKLLEKCPSIKNPRFKQYFFLPFTFCQFLLGEFCKVSKSDNKNKLLFEQEKIDDEGTSLYWGYYEKTGINHRNPVLFILPGITGSCEDTYIQNTTIEALNNNYDVVIFQMRTLSSEMKMPKNKYVDFYEDINKSLIKIKNKNKNIIHAIGFSYGANLLCGYLGNKNLETNYIEGGIAISNPFDLYFSQRFGEDTLYESLISYFEKKTI
jgi:predicted alpha/beta-fold hydrolase